MTGHVIAAFGAGVLVYQATKLVVRKLRRAMKL